MLSTESLTCPWCDAPITVVVDASAGEQTYVEDCEVCCQPLTITLHIGVDGELLGVDAEQAD